MEDKGIPSERDGGLLGLDAEERREEEREEGREEEGEDGGRGGEGVLEVVLVKGEHETRQRCTHALLVRAAKRRERGGGVLPPLLPIVAHNEETFANSAAIPILTQWVLDNAASVAPSLLLLAKSTLPTLTMR